jgi:hypothetical protein
MMKGKEVTELGLARQLRPYGVRPRTMWIGERAAKGYMKTDFAEAFGRYIPKLQAKALLEELAGVAAGEPGAEEKVPGIPPVRVAENVEGKPVLKIMNAT